MLENGNQVLCMVYIFQFMYWNMSYVMQGYQEAFIYTGTILKRVKMKDRFILEMQWVDNFKRVVSRGLSSLPNPVVTTGNKSIWCG